MIENKLRQWVETVRRKPAPLTEAIPMVCQAADEIETLRAENETMKSVLREALEVLDIHRDVYGATTRDVKAIATALGDE